eukprot:g4921.t1
MEPNEDIIGKSPTTLLIGGNTGADKMFQPSTAEAYGRVAQRRYAENDIPPGAQLFKRFKMQLHHEPSKQNYDDLSDAVTKSASSKAIMMLLDIFVLALEYIKEAALARMTVTQAVRAEDVTWVLTVPVCCSEPAKFFMRQAAIKAGYIQGGNDDEGLVLCMEPVAACLALGDRLSWKMNDKYLVIDCGGGTVDISAFTVANVTPARLDQLGKAVGGPWGSTKVDEQFEGYLKDFVHSVAEDAGERSLKVFFASSAMYRILQAWERAKVSLRSVKEDCRIDLSELSRMPLEVEMESMDNGRRLKNRGGEELVGGEGTWDLVLRPALLRKFFKPQCDSIGEAVSEQLDMPHLQGLTSVVMVGGFSGSIHVQEVVKTCLRKKYPDNSVNMVVAPSPDLAIVQGAAHYAPMQQAPPPVPLEDGAPPPYGAVETYPTPEYNAITAPNSYGILAAEVTGGEAKFDPFFLKGQGYFMKHVVQKQYNVKVGEPFVLSITSCTSSSVREGCNRVADVGGDGQLQKNEFTVASPPPIVSTGCCGCPKSAPGEVQKVNIVVEFTLNGIELHVRVKSRGTVLLQQTVPFLGC